MDGHEARLGRHLGPVADAADMATVLQGHQGKAERLAFVDADLHRLRRHGLAEAVLAIDDRQHRRFADDVDGLIGDRRALAPVLRIARHTHHTVAVMAGEIGDDEIAADARRFFRR